MEPLLDGAWGQRSCVPLAAFAALAVGLVGCQSEAVRRCESTCEQALSQELPPGSALFPAQHCRICMAENGCQQLEDDAATAGCLAELDAYTACRDDLRPAISCFDDDPCAPEWLRLGLCTSR